MKRILTANFLLSDALPFVICFVLMLVPYMLFEPHGLFTFELFVPKQTHLLLCGALIAMLGASAYLGARLGRRYLRIPTRLEATPNYQMILWLAIWISIAAHVAMLATSGAAFLHGGFVTARDNFLFQGLGVFMRLYIPALPMLAVSTKRREGLWLWTAVLGVLVLLRSIILSERLAVIEFVFTLWVVAKILRVNIRLTQALLMLAALAAIFMGVLSLRILTQRDGSVRDDAATFAGSSMVAYYADSQNKLYYYGLTGDHFPEKGYMAPFAAFTRNKAVSYESYAVYLTRMSLRTRAIIPMLTNPGGMTLFVSDFGIAMGVAAACLSFFICGYAIASIRALKMSTLLGGLLAIQIADFPRENYIELPFATYVAIFAVLLRITQAGFVFRFYPPTRARQRPGRRSISSPGIGPAQPAGPVPPTPPFAGL